MMEKTPRIVIGTSGYSYDDWREVFYPKELPRGKLLDYYAEEFDGVEINFTYYSFPSQATIARIAEKTPKNFVFSLKANQIFTHSRENDAFEAIPRFLYGIAPLVESEKLKSLLFQFPYSFHYTRENRFYLDRLLSEFIEKTKEKIPLAVEFRNTEWFLETVVSKFKEMNTTLVNVDLPRLNRLPLPGDAVTSEIAYIRFHGRNRKNWWKGDNVSRYDYLYSKDELEEWLPLIERVISQVKILLIFFNNHHKGKAVLNARMMREVIGV